MKSSFDDTFLARWMAGELTETELQEFKNSGEYEAYAKIAQKSQQFQPPEFNQEAIWQQIGQKKHSGKVVPLFQKSVILKIAATVALLIGAYFGFQLLNNHVQIETHLAEQQNLNLPDGSYVTMNATTEISYDKKDWEKNRKLSLTGEAFFKVTKGNTFDVVTPLGTITVVGTLFNVNQRAEYLSVYCFEGMVKVSTQHGSYMLTKGNSLTLLKGEINKQTFIPNGNPNWMNGESSFNDMPVKMVLEELERQYPVTVNTKNINKDKRFTGSFTHKNLQTALRSVCEPLEISFTINDKQVLLQNK